MPHIPVPYERIEQFKEQLGINSDILSDIDTYIDALLERKEDFSHFLYLHIKEISPHRNMLEHESSPGSLKRKWEHWFDSLLLRADSPTFSAYLWKSGLTHVELNIDHRSIHLAYTAVRRFCHDIIRDIVPVDKMLRVTICLDKLLDFCSLVETDAFISATTQCDREVIMGISHQVRNPVSIIGGNISRLLRKEEDPKVRAVMDTIYSEALRLERMVKDIGVFIGGFQGPTDIQPEPPEPLLQAALEHAMKTTGLSPDHFDIQIEDKDIAILGDKREMTELFARLFENALEYSDPHHRAISVVVRPSRIKKLYAVIEILNNGESIPSSIQTEAFTPFTSSKATGTGFGLPIARLLTVKNLGTISLVPVPDYGTKCTVSLPAIVPSLHDKHEQESTA
ncbi:ATP-binding protein [Desulfovibrio inopinatus]|uniref:ATP-binding protein n=1 Tax=Desulfovibrio inopinatus TaxID=102109 RepID=UPI00040F9DAC|nr:ATP-binding protein [Desulfovibrio inopinatus]